MEAAFMLAGGLIQTQGAAAGQQWEAQKAQRAAEVGRVQADQVDASYRRELNSTVASIRAFRASSGAAINSPTGMAIEANEARKSDRDRRIEVGNRRMQATQDEADARFRKSAAKVAFFGGTATSLGKFFGS